LPSAPQGTAGSIQVTAAGPPVHTSRLRTVLLTAGVTAVVVAGAMTALWFFVVSGQRSALDTAAVTEQVTAILVDDFKIEPDDGSVSCPDKMKAKAQEKYICSYTVGGAEAEVQLTMANDSGQFLVGMVGDTPPEAFFDPLRDEDNRNNGKGWAQWEDTEPEEGDDPEQD
jgi:hypothetical protein